MTRAALADRIRAERRPVTDGDGAGNTEGDWAVIVGAEKLRGAIQELRGDESVAAQKLQGRSPCLVLLRASRVTSELTTDDRLIDLASDRVLNIRYVTPAGRSGYVTLLCESGVAT